MILLETLARWLDETDEPYKDTMALATATPNGIPSVRTVSLRGITSSGVHFFTGYASRKARELDSNPNAAALFFFRELRRQVRLEGIVHRLSDEENDAYFASRPLGHQISTIAWMQGARIESLDDLVRTRQNVQCVKRPNHWGGYVLEVRSGELWLGGTDRMHERYRYENGGRTMLAP
jgi:pyridoxamine 5'-phosphate oxidase